MSEHTGKILFAILVAAVVFLVLRWMLGRFVRLRRRREPETVERALWGLEGRYVRPSRRWHTRGDGVSLDETPFGGDPVSGDRGVWRAETHRRRRGPGRRGSESAQDG